MRRAVDFVVCNRQKHVFDVTGSAIVITPIIRENAISTRHVQCTQMSSVDVQCLVCLELFDATVKEAFIFAIETIGEARI